MELIKEWEGVKGGGGGRVEGWDGGVTKGISNDIFY